MANVADRHQAGGGAPNKRYSYSKLKLDSLFVHFFSLPQSQQLVLCLLEDIKAGRPVSAPGGSKRAIAASAYHGSTPPLSPKKTLFAPLSPSRRSALVLSPKGDQHAQQQQHDGLHGSWHEAYGLPRFFFPQKLEEAVRLESHIVDFLKPFGEQLSMLGLKTLMRDAFDLPASLAYLLQHRLGSSTDNAVSTSALHSWLLSSQFASQSQPQRLFDILRQPGASYVTPQDLRPLMMGLLHAHPGLAFLHDSPEFQERYADTVIHRIFFSLNSNGSGRLTLRDLRRGDLLSALREVEAEDDVNRCTRYFSYEHFYVIYCKFWDLDTDHDFLLSRDDLLRYSNHALTYRITDRLFEQTARPFASGVPGRMGYEDFVWFILSEEDKTSDSALRYWFRACDLNGDDRLTPDELLWFYEEQLGRMECLSQETVGFEDVLAQMQDMLNPEDASCFTMRDLKRSRALAGTLFNVLFNLNKFVAFETRDPFMVRQEREEAASGASEWDRFARAEYIRLAAVEDEGAEEGDEGMVWGAALEAGL